MRSERWAALLSLLYSTLRFPVAGSMQTILMLRLQKEPVPELLLHSAAAPISTSRLRHCRGSHCLECGLKTRIPRRLTSRSAWKRQKSSRASFPMDRPSTIARGRNVVTGLHVIQIFLKVTLP